ncbi:uncharacterized protein LOC128318789 [Pangasianodon hypophthalmus]|uniref:uncharacterized protein LOC128318789 n=1 Tax=Pangasianodon hypophthalmus TaxID=310915 RepID=UPI00230703A5|nr:uncharacterized protein LOC128318789 [Pangasianodon hypophthalmus]
MEGVLQQPDQCLPDTHFLTRGGDFSTKKKKATRRTLQATGHPAMPYQDPDAPGPLSSLGGSSGGSQYTAEIKGLLHVARHGCRSPQCQKTHKPAPVSLIPFPIIGVPFERIGPKSARGHEFILVIVDYATRYPEAVPLQKATSQNIAHELLLLFSCVGITKNILTDQGTPFMSKLMTDLCRLLQVKHLRTSVYHPQTDGLVERFN